ncbi:hypothetical protein EDB83DRAFT_2401735, partial [Lactarius deliciosus]
MVRPAPPRPRTQGEGRRAQLSPPRRGRHQPNPTHRAPPRPARIRERRDGAPTPPRGPCQSAPPPPMHARGRVGASAPSARATPAWCLRSPPRRRTPGDARGSVRPAQPPPRGVCYPRVTPRAREEVHARGRAARTHVKGVHGMRDDATRARAGVV